MAVNKKNPENLWKKFWKNPVPSSFEGYPKVTIVIPTYNCAESISETMESLLEQTYPHIQVVIVDGGSRDQTLKILEGYRSRIHHLDFYSGDHRYAMLNQGSQFADGKYLNFLFPGDFYLSSDTVALVIEECKNASWPHLLFGGCLLRMRWQEPRLFHRPFTYQALRQGRQPTSLESCWFENEMFQRLGAFQPKYYSRGGYDLLCSCFKDPKVRCLETSRVLTDHTERYLTQQMVYDHFKETARIIYNHFGLRSLVGWVLVQKDLRRMWGLYKQKIKLAIFGQSY